MPTSALCFTFVFLLNLLMGMDDVNIPKKEYTALILIII